MTRGTSAHDLRDAAPAQKIVQRLFSEGLSYEYLTQITGVSNPVIRALKTGSRKLIRVPTLVKIMDADEELARGIVIPPLGAYRPAPPDLVCAKGHLVETWNRYYDSIHKRFTCRTCLNYRHNSYRWRNGLAVRTASEEPIDISLLKSLSTLRHYGWKWKGTETILLKDPSGHGPYVFCRCTIAPCGLVTTQSFECQIHGALKMGNAKQVHWAKDCPGLDEADA